jgi:hypothetical protein
MKPFGEALHDGFTHITDISDPTQLHAMRDAGIRIDDEGYYVFAFGDQKEYRLQVEPIGEDGHYLISLYKDQIKITESLSIWTKQ